MSGKTKIISIAIAVIAAIASAGAARLFLQNGGRGKIETNAQLEVFGNANGDDRIDQEDMDIIHDIISGIRYFKDYPLADANYDGVIDENDYELVKAIINADSKNKVRISIINYYAGERYVDSVMYPITAAAATASLNQLLLFKYLGIVDEIKGVSPSSLDSVLFPEYVDIMNRYPVLSGNVYTMDVEKVSNCISSYGISAIISEDNVEGKPFYVSMSDVGL